MCYYGKEPVRYREAPRLIEMTDEFDLTIYVYTNGNVPKIKKVVAFLAGKGIPYEDGFSGEQEKKDYVESTYPDFCSNFRRHEKEISTGSYEAIYCSHLAEEIYPDSAKQERRQNLFKDLQ